MYRTPFQLVDGEPIDLSIPRHRDVVLQRNKNLERAQKFGVALGQALITVRIEVDMDFFKCGRSLNAESKITWYGEDPIIDEEIKDLHCGICQTRYTYKPKAKAFKLSEVDVYKITKL